ncbi:hypothetical protein GALMADRAFT_144976 [Galerina marginata CBS 339.88]|uniref:Uncharacterized protein n=1 Tax=Galerina marginata (strain CBS 339.88) TaxID=685588 RepID=A0A067SQG4_GALM3|nr:hypothetical protein GALMADRAFT_144976 [Galerina marginata CBS 339.88]
MVKCSPLTTLDRLNTLKLDVDGGTRTPFTGFLIPSILFGIVILQAGQYFMNYPQDSKVRKTMILIICFLQSTYFGFLVKFMYTIPTSIPARNTLAWGSSITQVLEGNGGYQGTILLYIFLFAISIDSDAMTSPFFEDIAHNHCSVVCVIEREKHSLPYEQLQFLPSPCLGLGAEPDDETKNCTDTEVYIRCYIYLQSSESHSCGYLRIENLPWYTWKPSSLTYLIIDFSGPSLYTNSILALFNAKSWLKERMDVSVDLQVSSKILFGDNDAGDQGPSAAIRTRS